MKENIPVPAIERLTKLFSFLQKVKKDGKEKISSAELSLLTGFHAHNIRKDISMTEALEGGKDG
jgi:NADH/NAD ratio-sensing transcriptional regulator Rex